MKKKTLHTDHDHDRDHKEFYEEPWFQVKSQQVSTVDCSEDVG